MTRHAPATHQTALVYLGGHALTREAMHAVLARHGFRLLPAVSLQDALDALDALDADGPVGLILIDDDGLGEVRTLEAIETLLHRAPEARIGVISASRSPVFPADVLRAGGAAYLSKETGIEELRHAIDRMTRGHLVVDPMITRTLLGLLGSNVDGATGSPNGTNGTAPGTGGANGTNGNGHATAPLHLTAIERKVLTLVADGKANKQIGSSLGISPLTVKNHLARIRARLGAGDKAQALAIAMRAGLLD